MKQKTNQLTQYIIENPAKVRLYLSLIFSIIMIYIFEDILVGDSKVFIFLFLIAPIVIYLITVYIFKKK